MNKKGFSCKLLEKTGLLFFIMILGTFCLGCKSDANPYKTFQMEEGTVHFSCEFPSKYTVDYVNPGSDTGSPIEDLMSVTLLGPKVQRTKYHTRILILADQTGLDSQAKEDIEQAEQKASTWDEYRLLDKHEITVDGFKAYRIDYQMVNITLKLVGASDELLLSVYREVRFDANGFVWMIQMESDSSTAEEDKADFEHILETFKILD